jgi:glycosyltransferase involved in cell wall biosynthesis
VKTLRHLLLVTLEDPYDPRSWSGTPFNMRSALEGRLEKVSVLARLKPKRTPMNAALRLLLGGKPPRYPLYLTRAAQLDFARQTRQAVRDLKPDAVLAVSSHCLVRLDDFAVPYFMVSDAPWLSWKETYRDFDKMPLLGPGFARLEAAAARRCDGLIFSSDWACEEAERLYQVPPAKLHRIPLGANWAPQLSAAQLQSGIAARSPAAVNLLYVGKDWERKGGPLAVDIALDLKARGVGSVTLHVVGCTPTIPGAARDIVRVHGFLNAQQPAQAALLEELFLTSHFLVVPTRAECFGLVFAEAQAFALPVVSRAVQAVPSIVIDGVTGILEPPGAAAPAYAARMAALLTDPPRYRAMAEAARARFETEFTWSQFAERVAATMSAAL